MGAGRLGGVAQRERFYRFLVESSSDVIFLFRIRPRERFEYVSPSVQQALGYSPDEFYADVELGSRIVSAEDQERIRYSLQSILPAAFLLRVQHKDGRLMFLHTALTPIYDNDGNLIALHGIARDVTEDHLRSSQ